MGSGGRGRRCATTSVVRSTRRRIHRLWREEALQVKVVSSRQRAGASSIPPVDADAPKVVWAIDFQFDSTIDGKAIKIASMIDEHTRESLLNIVDRSITGERLVEELKKVFAAVGGPPKVLRMDNGPELVFPSFATVLRWQGRALLYPTRNAVEQRLHRIVQQSSSEGVPQPQPLEHPVRGPGGHRRLQARPQPPAPALGSGLTNAGRVRRGVRARPHSRGLRDQLNPEHAARKGKRQQRRSAVA
jgi:transposase InsO family protein